MRQRYRVGGYDALDAACFSSDTRIGTWVDPLDVVANGGLHQHGVSRGVAYLSAASPATKFFAIDTLDAAVVDPATAAEPAEMFPQPLHPLTGPVLGFDVQLMQNGEWHFD